MKQAFYCSELCDLKFYARFEVIKAVSTNVTVARYVTIWGQVEIYQNIGQTYCVFNEREESVVNQHNLFRKMLYSNNETTCFGL